ncbi:hypothetical protein EV421DRAFT_1909199 [Armillaria borealis]|uniref:Uncharacterized protein n=1 Tax=Armillaria borealis TaxID=47425 RepID=A0AA39J242_9AGAR|nr:hypothetical protein EV421DRAFT_1909199 [Armillaria borealis]
MSRQLSHSTETHPHAESDVVADSLADAYVFFDFDSLFEDHVQNFTHFGSLLFHPYTDLYNLDVAIIGVLPFPRLYEYAIRLDYSPEQRLWLADQTSRFEDAVLNNKVLLFFEQLWEEWFCQWPVHTNAVLTEREHQLQRADMEQRKIEIFTLYIMGLRNKWVDNVPPQEWSLARVFAKLDELEEIITEHFFEVEHLFTSIGPPEV